MPSSGYNDSMINPSIKQRLRRSVEDFHLPRYGEIPDFGLYLEQLTQYVNRIIVPIGCAEITPSMISNYVKKGVIPAPQKKQYSRDQIVYLLVVAITKSVLPFDSIVKLFDMQRELYTLSTAYDYFGCELENMLSFVFGVSERPEENLGSTHTEEKALFRNVIISVSHSLYISAYFDALRKENQH